MRITEPNDTLAAHYAQIRPQDSGPWPVPPADQTREPATGAGLLSVLDTDHDGWLDENDIPYDHLVLRERELRPSGEDAGVGATRVDAGVGATRVDAGVGATRRDADVGAVYTRAAATPSPAPAREVRSVEVAPKARGDARVGPQIDLLA